MDISADQYRICVQVVLIIGGHDLGSRRSGTGRALLEHYDRERYALWEPILTCSRRGGTKWSRERPALPDGKRKVDICDSDTQKELRYLEPVSFSTRSAWTKKQSLPT